MSNHLHTRWATAEQCAGAPRVTPGEIVSASRRLLEPRLQLIADTVAQTRVGEPFDDDGAVFTQPRTD